VTQMALVQVHLQLYKQLASAVSPTSFRLEQGKNYAGRYLLTHRYFNNITTFGSWRFPGLQVIVLLLHLGILVVSVFDINLC
jgi:hypothetical protein